MVHQIKSCSSCHHIYFIIYYSIFLIWLIKLFVVVQRATGMLTHRG